MKKKFEDCSIAILSGGKSSRMGVSKAFVPVDGRYMLSHVIEAASGLTDELFIVANKEEYKVFGLPVFEDLVKEKGPAGGLLTALHHTTKSKVLLLSCDIPFITTSLLTYIIENSSDNQITVTENNNGDEPLISVYPKKFKNSIIGFIDTGTLKLGEVIEKLNPKKLMIPESEFPLQLFKNINTPSDLERINSEIR